MRPEWRLSAAVFPFDGGAPGSSAADRPSSSRSSLCGRASIPSPEAGRRRLRLPMCPSKMMMSSSAAALQLEGAGPPGPLSGDPPVTEGLLPIQVMLRSSGDGSCHRLVFVFGAVGIQKGLIVILFYLWTFLFYAG